MATTSNTAVLVAPTTSAVTLGNADHVFIPNGQYATFVATNLSGAEEVDLHILNQSGGNKAVPDSDAAVVLTATQYLQQIRGPLKVGIAKDATTNPCAVEVWI